MYSTRFQRQQEEIERIFGDSEVCVVQKEIYEKAEKIFLHNLFRQSFLPMKELFFGKVWLYSYCCKCDLLCHSLHVEECLAFVLSNQCIWTFFFQF